MAPKRRGRPRKTDKPVDDNAEKQETSASAEPAEEVVEEEEKAETEPSPKKSKVEEKKQRGRKPKATTKKAAAAAAAKKAADDDDAKDAGEDEEAEEGVEEEVPAGAKTQKVVIIEASKECNCFKTRAAKVQTGLINAFPGIEVLINPEKPRKGCFEVRGKDGNIYLSLLGLPRPFTKLKNLDMDKAVEEIVEKVK